MEKLLPLLLLLFSGQTDKTPNFTEQCKAIFGSAIFEDMSLGKWKAKEIANMIAQLQSLQKNNIFGNLQKGKLNLDMLSQLCQLFQIKMPKGLDFNTISNLTNLATSLKISNTNTKKDACTDNTHTSLQNPLAPIIQIANADIIYILTNYFTAA